MAHYNERRKERFMSTTITGVVTNGVVVPNSPLPEGAKVEVTVLVPEPSSGPANNGARETVRAEALDLFLRSPAHPRSARPALTPPATNFMNAFDTNIWLYSHDRRDPHKQAVAQQLIAAARPLALPWQVGCEFVAASRKLAAAGFTETHAWAALAGMRALADVILLPVPDLWAETQALQARHSLSFWDAILIANCLRGGVQFLYTEDIGAPEPSNICR